MIELLSQSRCVACDLCVDVCPTRVFDAVPGGPPVIARQGECQTCFMCELYCPADALYVSPQAEVAAVPAEAELIAQEMLGSYRRAIGWSGETRHRRRGDSAYVVLDKYFSDTL
jgi:NAD-dependent dihydropyrimidine dehydrogenase PreA subunit